MTNINRTQNTGIRLSQEVKEAIKLRAVQRKEKASAMVNLSIRIEADVFQELTDIADSDNRTVSYVGRELILAALKK